VSFILDALRKSETERQRLSQVAIADLPVGRRRSRQPWWVFALSGLLLLNFVVLAAVLLRRGTTAADVADTSTTPAIAPTTQPAAAAAQQTSAPVAMAASVAASSNNVLHDVAAPPEVEYETITREQYEMEAAAATVPDGPTLVRSVNPDDNTSPSQAPVSTYYPTDPDNPLELNLHVYSRNAKERFVMINMRRYTEGQLLPSGATVEQITPDGVIIYHNGLRFQLNRS